MKIKNEKTIKHKSNPVLLTACMLMSIMFFACGGMLLSGCDKGTNQNIPKLESITHMNERYVVVPDTTAPTASGSSEKSNILNGSVMGIQGNEYATASSEPVLLDQWHFNGYTYSQFYLGYIQNVPINFQTPAEYSGSNDMKILFEKSICTETVVEDSLSTCESITKSSTDTVSTNATVSTEGGFDLFVTDGKLGVSVSAGWQGEWTDTKAVSTTNTYTTAESYSEANSYTVEYTINSGAAGYYRYTLFGTTDVFGVCRTDKTKKDGKLVYEIDYAYCARPDSYFYALDYSADGNFETSTTAEKKLELKASDLDSLTTMEPVPAELNDSYIGSVSYDSSTESNMKNRTRYGDDGQYYGLNTAYADSDKLDMSKFKLYFYESYIFEFSFELSMNIENDGKQEFYLYNKATSGMETTSKKTRSEATKLGLLCEKIFNYKKGDTKDSVKFTMRVAGNVIRDTMFTKFGASGDGEDKWRIAKVKCTTKVYKTERQVIYNKDAGKLIKDDGAYGLKCTTQADKIDLSKYSAYFNTSNEFILTFSFKMHEIDDGSQEIFLYNNNDKKSSKTSFASAKANGFVRSVGVANPNETNFDFNRTGGADKTDAWVYFSVKVSGDKLNNNMYLRYDADGNDGDTWCLKRVNTYVTVVAVA